MLTPYFTAIALGRTPYGLIRRGNRYVSVRFHFLCYENCLRVAIAGSVTREKQMQDQFDVAMDRQKAYAGQERGRCSCI